MLKEPTLERLQALRLLAMATAWDEQQRHPDIQSMTFDERFALLVEAGKGIRSTTAEKLGGSDPQCPLSPNER
ncbi:MAG TPA: hypothetical protein VFQ61_26255 [Polyangiaceae bacterium]|nr:hypothetical protein [Polyangiaceae bacterium]